MYNIKQLRQLSIPKQCFTFGAQGVQHFCPCCRVRFVHGDTETAVLQLSGFEAFWSADLVTKK